MILALLFFWIKGYFQNIIKIEYYIDTDPGNRLATDVPIKVGTPIKSLAISIPMTNISDGFHQFFARAKDVKNYRNKLLF